MEAWDSINTVTNYIEAHLADKLTIEDLAKTACLSPFYFQKLFKRLVGTTAMEYVKFRRLAKISEELKLNNSNNILTICLQYGFENPETFSRNFKEAYGMTPSEYRNNPIILSHFTKPDIALHYTIIDEDVPIVTDGIVLEVTRKTLAHPKYFSGFTATGVLEPPSADPLEAVWNTLHQTKKDIKGYLPDGNEIGVNLNLAKRTKEVKYFAGAETDKEYADDTLEHYTLTARNYIVCQFEAENFEMLITDTITKVYQYMYLWVRNKKIAVSPEAIELYYGSTPDSSYMELWIPLKGE
ncbi:AraC family transcriptional regulator [Culicoidibacter larvae]|uniref:AraC family transcriptional regulator n=1 Tax=Culicoidibacter larvae TaxID=2579976 RepID=A0A5R8QGV1_9FIRM|nr:AraC family transcriptional regulator [Culicoidibacter larvae]TLG77259.1 AraC family transcriptional regulator [Culicoidibacter larvae]